jgi:hypothetical protein
VIEAISACFPLRRVFFGLQPDRTDSPGGGEGPSNASVPPWETTEPEVATDV